MMVMIEIMSKEIMRMMMMMMMMMMFVMSCMEMMIACTHLKELTNR